MGQPRQHIPYRNSMMTTVLRDSLGGNCRTVMIANITGDSGQMDESISTCRFAQRVAMVSNTVRYNTLSHMRRPFMPPAVFMLCLSDFTSGEGPADQPFARNAKSG